MVPGARIDFFFIQKNLNRFLLMFYLSITDPGFVFRLIASPNGGFIEECVKTCRSGVLCVNKVNTENRTY